MTNYIFSANERILPLWLYFVDLNAVFLCSCKCAIVICVLVVLFSIWQLPLHITWFDIELNRQCCNFGCTYLVPNSGLNSPFALSQIMCPDRKLSHIQWLSALGRKGMAFPHVWLLDIALLHRQVRKNADRTPQNGWIRPNDNICAK